MNNLLHSTESSLLRNTFANGLDAYTQTNCQVTLRNGKYRIYRPANLVHDSSTMHNMWGGLIIKPFNISNTIMVDGGSYCLMFTVDGQSSNNNEYYWSNNAGWTGGNYGLGTSPTTLSSNMNTGSDFQGTKEVYYAFKITDTIMKTCTKSYASYTEGNSYNTYRDFKWGYNYANTGAMGTEIYISNIRMYDISNIRVSKIIERGVLDTIAVSQYCNGVMVSNNTLSMNVYGETKGYDFKEY